MSANGKENRARFPRMVKDTARRAGNQALGTTNHKFQSRADAAKEKPLLTVKLTRAMTEKWKTKNEELRRNWGSRAGKQASFLVSHF